MKTRDFDQFEQDALENGANAAGQYLDDVGETDLAKLEGRHFFGMFGAFLVAYANRMNHHFEETKATMDAANDNRPQQKKSAA